MRAVSASYPEGMVINFLRLISERSDFVWFVIFDSLGLWSGAWELRLTADMRGWNVSGLRSFYFPGDRRLAADVAHDQSAVGIDAGHA